ncbi:HdeD family acid-resistance protein [Mycobacterium sp. pV006]|uniref:HdeD family acid-resistance protein n=1 Tax=Mycobacterium sp. pV006 TaxID=3238983 RepID=UPI00351BE121
MDTTVRPKMLQHLWKTALFSGLLAVLLGVMVLVWPGITIVVAAIFFGAYLLVTGVTQVIFAFSLHVSAGGRVLLFLSGAAALILAVLCFRSLQESILLLAIWIGIGFIFRGVATAVSAISDPSLPGRAWEIFIGVISLIAGVVMMAAPFESLATLTLVVGIWLIVLGVFEVVSAFGVRKESKKLADRTHEATPAAAE